MSRKNTDVRSAQSAVAKLSPGLAYLFERAGSKAVIASLSNAEDSTTKAIMVQFYQNLKKGMSKDEALRQAKLSQNNDGVLPHPFYWSPFVLIGDAR